MLTVGLVLFFAIPSAICGGYYRKEVGGGQLDVLSTLPGVRNIHSAIAWCICSTLITILIFAIAWLFFSAVGLKSPSLLPAITLLLLGSALGMSNCVLNRF
jgi:hypothetical protein